MPSTASSNGEDSPLLTSRTSSQPIADHEDHEVDDEDYLKDDDDKDREATERSLLRKLDLRMSFLIILDILNYVDRTNAAAARLRGFEGDLGLEGKQFSSVLSVYYTSYILMQIPSNMLFSQTSRPSLYLGCALMAPGIVTFGTGLVTTYHQALLARFLLGFTEAPFYIGAIFFLGRWYKRSELSTRMVYLISGGLISVAFGTLIASFLLDIMDGVLGLPAWNWLFFIEGGLTTVAGTAAMFILPDLPETKSISWLSPAEHTLARKRMFEDRSDTVSLPTDARLGFTLAVLDWKTWYLATAIFLETLSTSFVIFFPTLTATMGFSPTITLILCAPPWLVAAASSFWLSNHSDRTQERCMHVVIPFMVAMSGLLLSMVTMNSAARYLSLFLMTQGSASEVILYTWASSTVGDPPAKRAVALALITTISQSANIAGSYVWVTEWGPTYTKSFAICTRGVEKTESSNGSRGRKTGVAAISEKKLEISHLTISTE
ncbi:hypothetical protein D9756_009875 [Leucocoprinus leucothites]|uniref:Major facilitator superfamily (MFS) profile domain-containing protein n=1 Tax=Leucocoprinus leucothites TaxID=201217 RepID=A0A8H5CXB7_9AGAR|nr:hypothetical protein D9756_009875 [Leucoagaricus leucothites]